MSTGGVSCAERGSSSIRTGCVLSLTTAPHTTGAGASGVLLGCSLTRTASVNVLVHTNSPPACDPSCTTCAFNASFCTSCDVDSGMFLTDNACHSNGTLAGKCRVFARDGGCHICRNGFYRHEKTCIACDGKCRTCTNGESCSVCNEQHYMSVDGVCHDKSEIVGCAVEISSDVGCTSCLPGYFAANRMCSECNDV